jgi:hypothetical protein
MLYARCCESKMTLPHPICKNRIVFVEVETCNDVMRCIYRGYHTKEEKNKYTNLNLVIIGIEFDCVGAKHGIGVIWLVISKYTLLGLSFTTGSLST